MATPRSRTRSSAILHSARWVRLGRKRLFFNTRTPVRFLHWIWRQERCDFPKLLAECVVLTTAPVRREALAAVGGYHGRGTSRFARWSAAARGAAAVGLAWVGPPR